MASPELANDIRQLFAEAVLQRFERLEEADIDFTFNHGDVYLSSFSEALSHMDAVGFREVDPELLAYAQVFERFVKYQVEVVDPITAASIAGSFYWLAGYTANAYVLARMIDKSDIESGSAQGLLLTLLGREDIGGDQPLESELLRSFIAYIQTGQDGDLESAIDQAQQMHSSTLDQSGDPDSYIYSMLLNRILDRLNRTGFWPSIREYSSASEEIWQDYVRLLMASGRPVFDLWPSQRVAIQRGLLDGSSSLVIRTPTSSGKTKMMELAFVNDLALSESTKCLYLAPFRALVSEVEQQIGDTISQLGYPVASLYGGSEANQMEVALSEVARVTIATPEKMESVRRFSGQSLAEYQLVVLDEGDLIASLSRGAGFELQLSRLKANLQEAGRAIFISAVLPNSDEIAAWLAGSSERLVTGDWQPTTIRVGVVTWPRNAPARLTYLVQTGQPVTDGFFVPRLLETTEWKELYEPTGRERTHRFPEPGDNGKIAAALAIQSIDEGPVIIFSRRRDWADSIARKINDRVALERPIETNLVDETNRFALEQLAEYVQYRLGDDSILPASIRNGFAIHHGGIPQSVRLLIEDEYRRGNLKLIIATNTIAQGVNFPAKTIIVHSTPHTDAPIRDFWNLAGRAGRALNETQGEVLILATGQLRKRTLDRFLDRVNAEQAESVILSLVQTLLDQYLLVSNETINQLLADSDASEGFAEIIRDIDTNLLEILAEDAVPEQDDEALDMLTSNLFATHQSRSRDLELGTNLEENVYALMDARRDHVLNTVPDGARRRRLARTGLSVETSVYLEQNSHDLMDRVSEHEELNPEAVNAVINVAIGAVELEGFDGNELSRLAYSWISSGSYQSLLSEGEEHFRNIDDVVSFVENEFNYRIPWVLDGLIRLVQDEADQQEGDMSTVLPEWFLYLPAFIRYGVDTPRLVWTMSLGLADRAFAEWILGRYESDRGSQPLRFNDLIEWIIATSDSLVADSTQEWPGYFARILRSIVVRYSSMTNALNQLGLMLG